VLDIVGEANATALVGLFGGLILGLAARLGRFCTLGAIEDLLYSSDDRRMRMWVLAIGTGIIGTHLAMQAGLVAGSESAYLALRFSPLGSVIGGLLFGYGMAMAGNCGYGALARLGGGDLRSFVIVVVLGLSAYVAMSGPLARLRVAMFPLIEAGGTPQGLSQLAQLKLGAPPALTGLAVGALLIGLALSNARMRRSPGHVFWGVAAGLAVVSGWIGTTWIAQTGFGAEPVRSHSFAAPLGDSLLYLMTASGTSLNFSVGSVAGVLIGAVLGSLGKGHFRWEACEDPRELRRQIMGAAMMGPGAVLAVGCSVGQGLSAFSLLAYSAPLTFLSIVIGAALGLRHLISGVARI
jgi:uncharacterized membrane protein YedE/YeeE